MPQQQKLKTNVEFITELMEYSRFGGMVQVLVIQALRDGVEEIANYPHPEHFDNGLFDGTYWQAIAKDVARQLTEKYGPYNRVRPATD
ncbi:hypothetical protein [Alicycliphilus denitrificans]|uniref:hypothetical protein n=1 Tax=Alicycliphilus denitrificans TaxID=179636 RepID=UPI00384E9B69